MGLILFFIGSLFLTYSVKGDCSNGCSGHGSCVDGSCVCAQEYLGEDCSIRVRTLQSGVMQSSTVPAWGWDYYVLETSKKGGLLVDVEPVETILSDCDLFVRKEDLPDALNWDYSDNQWGTRSQIVIPDADSGRWYFGVLANFLSCKYSIVVSFTGGCVGSCVHGTCTNGSCACDAGWAGNDCSIAIPTSPLVLGQPVGGNVTVGGWDYHFLDLKVNVSSMFIEVNITSTPILSHDCDLFVNLNALPTLVDWLYQDSSISSYFKLDIPNPAVGRWYFGVWGFQQCNYVYTVRTSTDTCISRCSNHGTCGPPCRCEQGFRGLYCETKIDPLVVGEKVSGFVGQNSWNYFTFEIDASQQNVKISITQTSGNGDIDLYVKVNGTPTRWDYDFIDISRTSLFELVIDGIVSRNIGIGLFGWIGSTYEISVTRTANCAFSCAHGKCVSGVCVCDKGWNGPDCNSQHTTLQSGVMVQGNLSVPNTWMYYNFMSSNSTVDITMREVGVTALESGLLYLLVAEGREPTLRVYDYADNALNKPLHSLTINLDNRKGNTEWVIGVYATARVTNSVNFKLVVWEG